MPSVSEVYQALQRVVVPELGKDLVSGGWVRDLVVEGGRVRFGLKLPASARSLAERVREESIRAVRALSGVEEVEVRVEFAAPAAPPGGIRLGTASRVPTPQKVPGIEHILLVASGKGGVGKSTVAANIAVGLAQKGFRVGLIDGDIYGPSIPRMFGIEGMDPPVVGNKLVPVENYGVKVISIGLLIGEEQPVIWRGPMIHKAYAQFFTDVLWGELDYMIFDLPPGTGDAQLSLAQQFQVTGGIAVTTPQDVSLLDVRRAIRMFQTVGVEVLGVVENMSYFICPHCGEITRIFGQGGGRRIEEEMGIPLLGQIPLEPAVTELCDSGKPVLVGAPESASAEAFRALVNQIVSLVQTRSVRKRV